MSIVVIRPVSMDDLDQVVELAEQVGHGLTSLPRDRQFLSKRIAESLRGFEKVLDESPRGESYLFVLEDLKTGRIAGISGIVSKVGGFEPFYAYRIESKLHQSELLKVRKEIQVLHLVADHNGPCEIGSLFLAEPYRRDGNGRLLSLSRFVFMAEHPQHFDPVVIAEMRGVLDEQGRSPFWDAIGRHFFEVEYPTADYLSVVNKRIIADLMPTLPIYIPMLPPDAQAVIGKVHKSTEPALRILQDEGFGFSGMVDIFEAGPVVTCPRDEIRASRQSVRLVVQDIAEQPLTGEPHIIGTTRRDFRACQGSIRVEGSGKVTLSAACALALRVKVGDLVRCVPSRAPAAQPGQGKEKTAPQLAEAKAS
jgi:arginine N-succinyltransferase